tara:strand:- start:6126 stop:6467 length:342 start_codon:yes stop_codon:yes gene_type:complete
MIKELAWNVDGHRILINVNNTEIDVTPSICPFGAQEDAPCYHEGIQSCVVNYFINTYGLETNTGVAPAQPSMEIAWAMSGSKWEVDLVDLKIIPVDDPNFSEWYNSITDETSE